MIRIAHLSKTFTLHNQGGVVIPVLQGAELTVEPGSCVALTGASGAGKSTLMRLIWAITWPPRARSRLAASTSRRPNRRRS